MSMGYYSEGYFRSLNECNRKVAKKRPKYKLIVEGDWCGFVTKEYQHTANNLKEATKLAKQLLNEYKPDYPDCRVGLYPMSEDIKEPYDHYRVFATDCFGGEYWRWMKVSNGLRINITLERPL